MRTLALLALATVAGTAMAQVTYGPGPGGSIPDASPAGITSTINVPLPIIRLTSVTIIGLTHTWVGDVTATLTHVPSGQSIDLFHRIGRTGGAGFGDSSDFGGNYTFIRSTEGGGDLWAAAAAATAAQVIPPGQYWPSGEGAATELNFNIFNGAAAGNWALTIRDLEEGDTGAFQNWELNVDPVPEPASLLALGTGFAALAARRRRRQQR
jgi:hypothetical protein